MMKKGVMAIFLLITLTYFPFGLASSGEVVEKEVYLLVRERELVAFSALGNRWVTQDLISRERVLESKFDGHVAVAVTNLRVLGFSALTNRWREERLEVGESPDTVEAEGNVGVAITNLRAFGFSAKTGTWTVKRFGLK
ncbi:MAG: hypothetical protein GTO13_09520 [Proteobacteria bacterium]|nr:hypothetical protein [Pseudomonadota bacterium]